VREIFDIYLRLGSVFDLYEHLKGTSIRSKLRVGPTGKRGGGAILSRGTLYHLLSNPLYIGKIAHKGTLNPGLHQAIVSKEVWEKTASLLKENRVRRTRSKNQSSDRLLLGLLFDQDGNRFTPTHSSKTGRRYSYYISQAQIEGKKTRYIQRIPAIEVERLISNRVQSFLKNQIELAQNFPGLAIREMRLLLAAASHRAEMLTELGTLEAKTTFKTIVKRVEISESEAKVEINRDRLLYELLGRRPEKSGTIEDPHIYLVSPLVIKRRGQQVRLVISSGAGDLHEAVPALGRTVARSRDWADLIVSGKARTIDDLARASGLTRAYVKSAFRCVALSPSLIEAVLNGQHRVDLTVGNLPTNLSFDWSKQQL
jgi:site-specific DNA recombinase